MADLGRSPGAQVRPESDLTADLGLDSLAVVELHDRIQKAFDVRLPDELLATATTPADWVKAVREARGHPVEAPRPAVPVVERSAGEPWAESAGTLTEALDWHVKAHPGRTAIRLLGISSDASVEDISYGQLRDEASALARGLRAQGLDRGDRVAIMLPTSREYFVVSMGVLLAGGIPVPIYPPARMATIEEHLRRQAHLLTNAGASVLVTVPEAILAGRLLRTHVTSLRSVRTVAMLAGAGNGSEQLAPPGPDDIALIQYTSGSTGDPKGVVLTHRQLLANVRAMGEAARVDSSDVFVSWLPLYHDIGLIGAWHAGSLYFGMLLVVMSPLRFLARPASWLEAISEYSGTISAAPSFAYQSCVERISDAELVGIDLSSWRIAFNGSEPVSAPVLERFLNRFGPHGFRAETMCPAYGMAEFGVGVAFNPIDRPPRIDYVDRGSLQSSERAVPITKDDPDALAVVGCGLPLPGYEVRVVGLSGDQLPDRNEGSVECRGPSATSGYFNNEAANRALWHEGWLVTGDLGYSADGELFLTGRIKDVIIRAGRKLHPEDFEEVVSELPGVIPDGVAVFATGGEEVGKEGLVVVAETSVGAPGERHRLQALITQKAVDVLGAAPDEVVLAAPGTILRTANGKLRRDSTREAFEAGTLGRPASRPSIQLARFAWSGLGPVSHRLVATLVTWAYGVYAWVVAVLVAAPLALLVSLPLSRRARWRLARSAGLALCRLIGVTLGVEGSLPEHGAAVVVANHASFLDSAAMLVASPEPLVFAASSDLQRQRVIGGFLRRLGCLFLERGQPEHSTQDVDQLIGAIRAGGRVMIFPEGSITRAPGLRPFRLGAFAAATVTGCPVVPVGIRGTRDMLPAHSYLPRRGEIKIVIGAPLEPTGTGFVKEADLAEQARQRVSALSSEAELP